MDILKRRTLSKNGPPLNNYSADMTCLNDKNSNIIDPFYIKNLYHILDLEQPYKKGSSRSI